jgi:sugar lactone lactonase YvrE
VRVLVEGRGVLESVGLDRRGRLFFTDSSAGELLMLKRPGAKPKLIADGIESPGGLVFRRDRNLLVGFGNGLQQAADGTANPEAGLLKVHTQRGTAEVHTEGLQMANGVARGPGRAIYASNDITGGVDRVRRGVVRLNWAPVESANGMVADRARESLFVNQTFTGGTIQRVPFNDPAAAPTWFAADPPDEDIWFDGLTRDGADRLYAAAVGAGEVWRVSGPGSACVLATGDPFPRGPSDLAFGRKRGEFKPRSLYVTTFGGELLELVGARG